MYPTILIIAITKINEIDGYKKLVNEILTNKELNFN